jgi:putative transposase
VDLSGYRNRYRYVLTQFAEKINKNPEQAVYGQIFRTINDVRAAMAKFVKLYSKFWLVEKMGFKSPSLAREQFDYKAAAP